MKVKTLTLMSVAGSLALAGTSSAAFTGVAATSQTKTLTGGQVVDIFELYATFDSPADSVAAVGGTPVFPQILNSGGSGFWQTTIFGGHQNTANGAGAVGQVPNLNADSFLSIGVRQGFAGSPTLPTIQNFNAASFNNTGGGDGYGDATVTTTNGGWLVSPFIPVTAAQPYPPALPSGATFSLPSGATHGVIIGQFTVASGNTFSGDLGQLSIFIGATNQIIDNTNGALFSFTRPLPAPGALALLGLAGLAGTRRRRS
jgi:MYXO-CTERM domain-containing protein